MSVILILFCPTNIQRREPYLCDFVKKANKRHLDCWLVFRHLLTNFFKLGMMGETSKFYISVWMTFTFIQGIV